LILGVETLVGGVTIATELS